MAYARIACITNLTFFEKWRSHITNPWFCTQTLLNCGSCTRINNFTFKQGLELVHSHSSSQSAKLCPFCCSSVQTGWKWDVRSNMSGTRPIAFFLDHQSNWEIWEWVPDVQCNPDKGWSLCSKNQRALCKQTNSSSLLLVRAMQCHFFLSIDPLAIAWKLVAIRPPGTVSGIRHKSNQRQHSPHA